MGRILFQRDEMKSPENNRNVFCSLAQSWCGRDNAKCSPSPFYFPLGPLCRLGWSYVRSGQWKLGSSDIQYLQGWPSLLDGHAMRSHWWCHKIEGAWAPSEWLPMTLDCDVSKQYIFIELSCRGLNLFITAVKLTNTAGLNLLLQILTKAGQVGFIRKYEKKGITIWIASISWHFTYLLINIRLFI